jgi:hypothetical protein
MTIRSRVFGRGALGVTFVALALAACDRTYMTPTWGKSYREAFAVQTVNPNRRSEATAVHGLDSQEAAIIASGYRRALSPKEENNAGNQQLLMYSPRGGAQNVGNLPPPSVPDQR